MIVSCMFHLCYIHVVHCFTHFPPVLQDNSIHCVSDALTVSMHTAKWTAMQINSSLLTDRHFNNYCPPRWLYFLFYIAHKMTRSQVHVYTQQQLIDWPHNINNGNLSLSPFALLQVANEIWVCEKQGIHTWPGDIQSYKDRLRKKVSKWHNHSSVTEIMYYTS